MRIALAYFFFVSCTDLVWSQKDLIVRWNNRILVPDSGHPQEMIYFNEIARRTDVGDPDPDGHGVLICRYSMSNPNAGWRNPNGDEISLNINNDFFRQFRRRRPGSPTRVQLARTTTIISSGDNGLWTCNSAGLRQHVPIYTTGRGALVIDSLTLGTTSFSSTPPKFTLIADTSRGPATTFLWRYRNGTIKNDSDHRIRIQVNPNNDARGRRNCHYRSTLEVTTVAPGTYTYAASNRATSGYGRTFLVEGGDPSNLQVVQTGMSTIELTWDPSPGPPSGGYRVTNSMNSIAMNVRSNRLTITNLSIGVYNFQVTSLSRHFSGRVGPETIVVKGPITPNITISEVTATSVRVSWSSPPLVSFDVEYYEVALRKLTVCTAVVQTKRPRFQNADDRTEVFQGLVGYIDYSAEIRVIFQQPSFATVPPVFAEMEFTTLAAAPSKVSNVVITTKSRTISVSWDAIDCGNQNGPNLRYEVDFQRMDGEAVPVGTLNNQMFYVKGLQPFTNYTFRVRGVNDAGNGEYTSLKVIQIGDEAPSEVPNNVMVLSVTSRTFSVSWDAINSSNQNGPNFRYDVDFQRMDGGAVPVGTVSNEMFTVEGLQPYANYTFRVRGVNDAGNGNYTKLFMVQTDKEAPSEVPSNTVFNVNSRNISVSWNPINSRNRNGPNFRYQLEFVQIDSARPMVVTVNDSQILLDGLLPFTNYTFRVRGVNDIGIGNYTDLTVIQTNEDVPGIVSSLESQFINSMSLLIAWSPPLEPNGIITMYEFMYRLYQTALFRIISSDLNYVVVSQVNINVTEIWMRAYSGAGPGPFVQSINLTMPLTVTNVLVESLTATSVIVSWDNVTEISNITEYIVYYAPVKRQNNEQSVKVPSTESSVEISGLESTVEYQYQVTFIAEFGQTQIEGDRSQVDEYSRLRIIGLIRSEDEESVLPLIGMISGSAVIACIISAVFIFLWLRIRDLRIVNSSSQHSSTTYSETVNMDNDDVYHDSGYSQEVLNDDSFILSSVELDYSGNPQELLNGDSPSPSSVEEKCPGVHNLREANSAGSVRKQVNLTVQPDIDTSFPVTITINSEPIPVAEFAYYVAQKHSNGSQSFKNQFMALESGGDYAKTIGLSSKFKELNRFSDITNYDHNRIVLKLLQGHSEYNNDYINGCYIDGYSLPKKFIATQGPTLNTVVDFWRLIWQEKPPTIVMVTDLQENNKTKCEQYWPESGSKNFKPFEVTLTKHQVFADLCIVRSLQVRVEGSNYYHKIKQFHFTAWPNRGVPDFATPLLAFHRKIASAHNYHEGPMLVHCSAGVGRTGIFICIDNILEQIKNEGVVDIVGTINKMRHQRMMMVQTVKQYRFIYKAVMESIICENTD